MKDSPLRFLCRENGVDDGQWIRFVENLDSAEMKQLENNRDAPPNRKERFKITHLKKGSKIQYIDEESTRAVVAFEQKEAEKRNQNFNITLEVEEDIYADIFGAEKRNRVRGMGTGYTWSDVPFIHTENKGVSKEVAALRGAVEEQTRVAERASMEVERLRIEAEREMNEVYDR